MCYTTYLGNALTDLTATTPGGAIQADGSFKPEPTFDAKHVAESILHVAELPLSVTVLTFNIMYVFFHVTIFAEAYTRRRATTMPFVGRG